MSAKILLLEDDFMLSEILCEFLSDEGFSVKHYQSASSALEAAYEQSFDLWLLDVRVPEGNGFELLRELRSLGRDTPAIFITSLDGIGDLELGYRVGCDDYLKKPFELLELKCRIQTLLKRSFSHKSEDFITLNDDFKFGILEQILYKSTSNGDEVVPITQKETLLLSLLLQNRGSYVSQEAIFSTLWQYEEEPSDMSLRVYVKNLRKILGKDSIINQRGRGYCYAREH